LVAWKSLAGGARVAFERLTGLLENLGERNLQIHHVLILKVGCICLSEKDPPQRVEKQESRSGEGETITQDPYDDILKSLQEHPNIFDVRQTGDEQSSLSFAKGEEMFVEGKTFCLRVHLPERLQKFRDDAEEMGGSLIEEFNVLSTGSLFAAFARIRDFPVFTFIGQEYREIVTVQIDNETRFKTVPFGPSPLHPDFYLVTRRCGEGEAPLGTKVYSASDDVFVVMDQSSASDMERACELFWRLGSDLLDFYRIMMDATTLLSINERLFSHFSELSDQFVQMLQTSAWHPLKLNKLSVAARASLSNVYLSLVDHERLLLEVARDRNRFLKEVRANIVLSHLHAYLSDHTDPEADVPQSLNPTLSYFGAELQMFKNIRSIMAASLIGAAAGALLTAVLTSR
jgi:hypothetical protein